jgi:5'-methylthioadenosine phosphorylase
VCIEGPRFSSRRESELWRAAGADVVGMTALPEASLAREAELCYALLAMPTDYDAWRVGTAPVTAAEVTAKLAQNVAHALAVLADAVVRLDPGRDCACQRALDTAVLTPRAAIPEARRAQLGPLLHRYLRGVTP